MKNLHLIISTIILIPVALAYGVSPKVILPILFDFKPTTVDLVHIFRTIMTLYIGISAIMIAGIFKSKYWEIATITNFIFMTGLATGRLISFVLDGAPSISLVIGFTVEAAFATWGFINLKKYKTTKNVFRD